MLRNADMQRYPNDLHDFHDLYYLHDTLHTGMSYLISHLYFDQARPTAWGGWGYCDPLCNKGRNFGWEGQIKMLEVAHAYVINNILYNSIFCVSRCWGRFPPTKSVTTFWKSAALKPSFAFSRNRISGSSLVKDSNFIIDINLWRPRKVFRMMGPGKFQEVFCFFAIAFPSSYPYG